MGSLGHEMDTFVSEIIMKKHCLRIVNNNVMYTVFNYHSYFRCDYDFIIIVFY